MDGGADDPASVRLAGVRRGHNFYVYLSVWFEERTAEDPWHPGWTRFVEAKSSLTAVRYLGNDGRMGINIEVMEMERSYLSIIQPIAEVLKRAGQRCFGSLDTRRITAVP